MLESCSIASSSDGEQENVKFESSDLIQLGKDRLKHYKNQNVELSPSIVQYSKTASASVANHTSFYKKISPEIANMVDANLMKNSISVPAKDSNLAAKTACEESIKMVEQYRSTADRLLLEKQNLQNIVLQQAKSIEEKDKLIRNLQNKS